MDVCAASRPDGPAGPFATGYRPHGGDMMVYGGGTLTLVGAVAAVVNAEPWFFLAGLVGALTAFHFHPTLETGRAQLGADHRGVFVDRVGLIDWSAVVDMRIERRTLRTMNLAWLVLMLDRPVSAALLVPDRVPPLRRLTSRNARVSKRAVRVPLHTLAMPTAGIEARLAALRPRHE